MVVTITRFAWILLAACGHLAKRNRCEVRRVDGSPGWNGSGELFYGTDVVISGLGGGTRSQMEFEAEGRMKTRE